LVNAHQCICIVEILFANTPKEISAMAALKRTATRDLHFKDFSAIFRAFDISVNYCFSTKIEDFESKNVSFYLKKYCRAMVTLNLLIIQQLVDFCNISHKNEFTADILFVANKYSRRDNTFLTRATFHLF
jgi:hypothetical protein